MYHVYRHAKVGEDCTQVAPPRGGGLSLEFDLYFLFLRFFIQPAGRISGPISTLNCSNDVFWLFGSLTGFGPSNSLLGEIV